MDSSTEHTKKQTKEEVNSDVTTNKYVWIIGGIILLLVGWFGLKPIIAPAQEYKLTLIDAPKTIDSGNIATFTWRIDGPSTTINHTSVRFGTVSNPGDLGQDIKPEATKYTDFVRDFADGKFDIPLQFIGNHRMTTPGNYYFRVYAVINDKNYWSDEYTFDVKVGDYKVTLINAPQEMTAGNVVTFTWRVDGQPTTINHTAVHFGLTSHPGLLGKEVNPADIEYNDLVKEFASGNFDIPLQFVGNTKIEKAGTYYFRAHALINGQNYWTDEYKINVKGLAATVTP